MSIMSPEALVSLLSAYPYPGCIVTRPGGAVRLDFDGLTLIYKADGWHFGDLHLESKLNHFAAEATTAEIRRILKVVFSIKVGRALGEAETLRSEDPVEYLTDLCAEKMLAILDVAALANVRQAKIEQLTTDLDRSAKAHTASARDAAALIAGMECDLAAKDKSLKTAHAALTRICEVIGADAPASPADAVEAVTRQLGDDNDANRRAEQAEADLAEIGRALDAAGAPQAYHLEDGGERGIPDPERIRLLGERVHALRAQVREVTNATNYLDAIVEGHNALDALGAPCLADGCVLSLAARIRSLPR